MRSPPRILLFLTVLGAALAYLLGSYALDARVSGRDTFWWWREIRRAATEVLRNGPADLGSEMLPLVALGMLFAGAAIVAVGNLQLWLRSDPSASPVTIVRGVVFLGLGTLVAAFTLGRVLVAEPRWALFFAAFFVAVAPAALANKSPSARRRALLLAVAGGCWAADAWYELDVGTWAKGVTAPIRIDLLVVLPVLFGISILGLWLLAGRWERAA